MKKVNIKKILIWSLIVFGGLVIVLLVWIDFIWIKKFNPAGINVNKDVCRAETCAECHPQQYKEWHKGQLAAFAAVREMFEADQAAEFAGFICWKCHDPFKQGLDEGVTCEFCHGKTGDTGCDQADMDLHVEKRRKNLEYLRNEQWCHWCHSIVQPITKADLQGTVGEWEQSKARKDGLMCQSCHMPLIGEGEDKHHFHGHYYPGRNPLPGRKSISIESITRGNEQINVIVKNHVTSHYFPTGAHTKAMILEVKGYDETTSNPVFEDQYIFLKRFKFEKFLGIQDFPYTVYKDTRIKPEEERKITFNIDKSMKISKLIATLRCAFMGDLGEEVEAWTSDYIAKKEVAF
ncbi:MAG: hypothetical protein U9N83_14340 [Thermodesulfobacteriota bacterium]|nr:hypothetical protein [Thermodesulfobacteriota bacterium]